MRKVLTATVIGVGLIIAGLNQMPSTPTQTAEVTPAKSYTVQTGDTLFSIAAEQGTSIEAIQSENELSGTVIHEGQSLWIPCTK